MKLLALAVAATALALSACGSPCQDLADRICNCQPAGTLRDACRSSVTNQLSNATQKPGGSDETFCTQKLATCPDPASTANQCERLDSTVGKIECGLAYPTDAGF
jgi:hypothetical protein